MLNYYYDVILGLQYTYLGEIVILDIEAIPEDIKFDVDQWIKYLKETKLYLLESTNTPAFEIVGKITDYQL